MKYLCLGYHEAKAREALSQAEKQALAQECSAYLQLLRNNGYSLEATTVGRPDSAMTLRFVDGDVSVSDGPFVESVPQLASVMVLEARDLNHAIVLVSQLPCMRRGGGCLEIRPIQPDVQPNSAAKDTR